MIPFSTNSCKAKVNASSALSGVSSGTNLATRLEALSVNTPVGFPKSSTIISPPSTSPGLSPFRLAIPANSKAFALAKEAWPEACLRKTGLSGDTAFKGSLV